MPGTLGAMWCRTTLALMLFSVRKIVTIVEEIAHDHGPAPEQPALKGAVAAVVTNPYVGQGYGKGTIVGSAGEIEHGAMWHIPGGGGMRAALGKGTSIVPSTKKVAGVGARLDVPITHLEWSYVGSHYDAIEVGVPDGPKPDEMVVILAMACGGRVHARLAGGFTLADRGKPGVPA